MHRGQQNLLLPALHHLSLCLCFTAVPKQGPSRASVKLAAFVGLCLPVRVCLCVPARFGLDAYFRTYLQSVCQRGNSWRSANACLFVCTGEVKGSEQTQDLIREPFPPDLLTPGQPQLLYRPPTPMCERGVCAIVCKSIWQYQAPRVLFDIHSAL